MRIRNRKELERYYQQNNLITCEDKVRALVKMLKIRAVIEECPSTTEELLSEYEHMVLSGLYEWS